VQARVALPAIRDRSGENNPQRLQSSTSSG
jgi:hypothetical protein